MCYIIIESVKIKRLQNIIKGDEKRWEQLFVNHALTLLNITKMRRFLFYSLTAANVMMM